ncbi:MAG: hypothetical protein DME16_10875 [Candidatus Rokuibacteriota bacterium]|nr:MAG: hypothetical protein DME16_10875 [Candidatus Rokubacteria bacterium]
MKTRECAEVRMSRVVLLEALDQRLDQLHGRELSRGDQAPELGDREVVQVASHGVLPPAWTV